MGNRAVFVSYFSDLFCADNWYWREVTDQDLIVCCVDRVDGKLLGGTVEKSWPRTDEQMFRLPEEIESCKLSLVMEWQVPPQRISIIQQE